MIPRRRKKEILTAIGILVGLLVVMAVISLIA